MNTKKTVKEVKDYYLSNPKELTSLKEEKYKSLDYLTTEMTDLEFLNWYFNEYDFYIFDGYIQTDLILENQKYIIINNKKYIKYNIYHDTESNLKLYSFTIGNSFANFHVLNENDMHNFDNQIKKLDQETLNKFNIIKRTKKFNKNTFHPTDDDWYGTYKLDLKKKDDIYQKSLRKKLSKIKNFNEKEGYCELDLFKNFSNLDLWTLRISGNDDYSISKDFLSETEANNEWNRLLSLKYINHNQLKDYYFSN